MAVKIIVKVYTKGEEMQKDIARRREKGYRVVGNPFFGPPLGSKVDYLLTVGVFAFLRQVPVWTVLYEK